VRDRRIAGDQHVEVFENRRRVHEWAGVFVEAGNLADVKGSGLILGERELGFRKGRDGVPTYRRPKLAASVPELLQASL
jgi:hypothetical protein